MRTSVRTSTSPRVILTNPNSEQGSFLVYTTLTGSIAAWHTEKRQCEWQLNADDEEPDNGIPICLYIDPTGCFLLTGSDDGWVTMWDLRFRICVRRWCVSHSGSVSSICGFPSTANLKLLLSTNDEVNPGQTSRTSRIQRHVLIGAHGVGVSLWDLEKCLLIRTFSCQDGESRAVKTLHMCVPNGSAVILTCAQDGTLRTWSLGRSASANKNQIPQASVMYVQSRSPAYTVGEKDASLANPGEATISCLGFLDVPYPVAVLGHCDGSIRIYR